MNKDMVTIKSLRTRRDRFVLEVNQFSVPPGQVIGVVGPNGAGKTTLLEIIAGLRRVDAGQIEVFGRDPWAHPTFVRSSLGFMSDDLPVFDMRIGALLQVVSGYYPTWDTRLVDRLLAQFDLDPTQKAQKLSKGQGTRLRILLALAFQPQLLVLDEPASGLDLAGRRTLLRSVLDVVRDPTRSVLVSSHMLLDVQRIADRLLVLNKGQVVRQGATDALVGEERTLEEALLDWGAAG